MSIGSHVVEPRPAVGDAAAGGRRKAAAEPLEPVGEHRLVDDRLEAPARAPGPASRPPAGRLGGGSGSRSPPRPPSAASAAATATASVASSWRQSGRIGRSTPTRLGERRRPRPARDHERVGRVEQALGERVLAHLDPELAGAADELAASPRGGRQRRPRRRRRRPGRRPSRGRRTNDGVDPLDRDAERGLELAPGSRARRDPAR